MLSQPIRVLGVVICLLAGLISGVAPASASDESGAPGLGNLSDILGLPGKGPLRVMFVGDSITQGRQGDATYRYFVWKEFARQQVPVTFVGPYTKLSKTRGARSNYLRTDLGFETAHEAKASSKFPSHLKRLDSTVKTYRPDVIALMLGFNDAGNVNAATIAVNTAKYLEATWDINPKIKFVLGEITSTYRFSRRKAAHRNDVTSKANTLVRKWYADDPRVSIAANVTDRQHPWNPAKHSYDGIHPNMAGQSLLGYQFSRAFRSSGLLPAAPARPTSPAWRVNPKIESVSMGSPRAGGLRTVVLKWPTQARRIYVKGFRLLVQRRNGAVIHVQDSATAKSGRVRLGPGIYRARLIAWRGPMVSKPGPVKRFRVR